MSPAALMILATFIITILSYFYFYFYYSGHRRSLPYSYPIIGNLIPLILNRHRFLDWATDLLARAPNATLLVPTPFFSTPGLCTAHPTAVDHMLRTNFPNYVKGARFRDNLSDLLGAGIFAVDGELWHRQRKTASHEFSSRSLRSFVTQVVRAEIAGRLLPALRSAAASGRVIDLDDLFRRFAFDNICSLAFGVDPACLDPTGGSDQPAFFRDFDTAAEICFGRLLSPLPWLWKVKRLFNIGSEKQLRRAIANINLYAMKIIVLREEEVGKDKPDLLSRFGYAYEEFEETDIKNCNIEDEERRRRKRKFLRDMVISFILAGKDSTSTALSWFFWLLTSNHSCVKQIRQEIAETAAAAGTAANEEGDLIFGYEEVKGMHFLQAAVSESLRLYPPVPINSRLVVADDVLPDGTAVKAGWFADHSAYAMGRMESLWGKDCCKFSPERWLDGNGMFVATEPAKFPVFHAGPRACLGKEMAYLQMKAVAAAVLQGFEVEGIGFAGAGEESAPAYTPSLTLKMKGGFPVRIYTLKP